MRQGKQEQELKRPIESQPTGGSGTGADWPPVWSINHELRDLHLGSKKTVVVV